MSIYFPCWVTADIMIDNFLDDFKAYVTKNKEDMTALQFSFLPPEIFYAVPEEDRELFVKIYNIF